VTSHDDLRLALGSYAMGGLEPDEHDAVRAHVAGCPDCRAELARLAPLPGLLDLARGVPAVDDQPSPLLEREVLAGFERAARPARPPRSRWSRPRLALPALAAAAALVVALVVAVAALTGEDGRTLTLAGERASATVRLTPAPGGTAVELDAELPPTRGDEVYELWFVRPGGRVSAGTFRVAPGQRVQVALGAAASGPSFRRIGITRGPDARDPARNGPTVAAAPLPAD
jgi:anti-sigma-K factor RskA